MLLPPFQWIDQPDAFARAMENLREAPALGVDTEANSFFAYRERVCLIQISTEEEDFLVDPLAGLDLAPFGEILADTRVVKIFHDGEYDVGILKKDFGFSFANLFDTRAAVMALGSKKPGLANVLQERFQVTLDKKFQRSDWGQRPLSREQMEYARMDTRFLIPLHRQLEPELQNAGRMPVATSEFRRLERLGPKEQVFDPDGFLRIKDARSLDPLGLQALRALYLLREDLAKKNEVPPFRILGNETLIALARMRPKDEKGLTQAIGFTWKVARKIGQETLAALREAEGKGPMQNLPRLAPQKEEATLSDPQLDLYEKLKTWRKRVAESEGLDGSHVLRKEALLAIARRRPGNFGDLESLGVLDGWQLESYGADLLKIVSQSNP